MNKLYLFVSRNKDNIDVVNFKERRECYYLPDYFPIITKFKEFIEKGLPGELCRLYISVNPINEERLKINLFHFLLDNPTFDLSKIDTKICSLAGQKENQNVVQWLWDFDEGEELLEPFKKRVEESGGEICATLDSVNNYSILTTRFDFREVEKWIKDNQYKIENKKADGMLLMTWGRK